MLAIVAPGQGAQTPGMLSAWLEIPAFAAVIDSLAEPAGLDLRAAGTQWDADAIRDTAVAQPLIVATSLAALAALLPEDDADSSAARDVGATSFVAAGHSVGEIAATAAAGVLSPAQAAAFVAVRGNAMAEASALTPTGMSAVLGGDPEQVLATLERHGLTPANVNGAGQVVAAGTVDQFAALKDDPPAKARVIPLQVAGAFHTHHMATAVDALSAHAAGLDPSSPARTLLSNADGAAVADGPDALDRLVRQVSNPVRWDLCMATMLELGVTGLLELPPAGTLTGLAKRAMKGVELLALKSPDDLDAARDFVIAHAGSAGPAPAEGSSSS